jgi:hypothetical protein
LASFKVTIDRETFTITIDDEYYDDIVNHFKQDNMSIDDIYNTNKKSVILGAYINSLTQNIQNDKELKKIIDSIPIK